MDKIIKIEIPEFLHMRSSCCCSSGNDEEQAGTSLFDQDVSKERLLKTLQSDLTPVSNSNHLKIYTQNMWGIPIISKLVSTRFQMLAEIIRDKDIDVFCFQEVWSGKDRETIRNVGEENGYTGFCDFSYGPGMPLLPNFSGTGLVILSRYPILETFFFPYSINGNPLKIWHGDFYGYKGIGLVRLKTETSNVDVYITHTIAEYHKDHDEYYGCRLSQLYEASKLINSTRKSPLCLIAGDFNMTPDSFFYTLFVTLVQGIQDCWYSLHSNDKQGTYGNNDNIFVGDADIDRLDYLFAIYDTPSSSQPPIWTLSSCDICHYQGTASLNQPKQFPYLSLSDHEGIQANFITIPTKSNPKEEIPEFSSSVQSSDSHENTSNKSPLISSNTFITTTTTATTTTTTSSNIPSLYPQYMTYEDVLIEAGRRFYKSSHYNFKKSTIFQIIGYSLLILGLLLFILLLIYYPLIPYVLWLSLLFPIIGIILIILQRFVLKKDAYNYNQVAQRILIDIKTFISQ
ncbi:hypothetical protein WA158_007443 [Blastocystis sp. Blastoise]